jgi:hypothetical protein
MAIAVTIAAVALLTVVTLLVARAGGRKHQDTLNEHNEAPTGGDARNDERGRPVQPESDRPAGPDAEPMGVADPGDPSVDPTAERHR